MIAILKTFDNEKEERTHNGSASCGVKCLISSAVFQINFSAWLTVLCPEIPHERQAQKRCGKIRSAPLATPNRGFCHIGSADYIRRCCSSLRELRTSLNLQNPKNGSKLPSRDFTNPLERWQ